MNEFVTYTLLRIGLFVASFAVVWGVYAALADTINLLVVVIVAALLSAVLSWRLLDTPRQRLAASVQQRAERATAKFEELRSREDAD